MKMKISRKKHALTIANFPEIQRSFISSAPLHCPRGLVGKPPGLTHAGFGP